MDDQSLQACATDNGELGRQVVTLCSVHRPFPTELAAENYWQALLAGRFRLGLNPGPYP